MALLIDWTVVWFLTALMLLPFLNPDETGLRLGAQPFSWSSCEWRDAPEGALGTPRGTAVAAGSRICTQYAFGIYNGRAVVVNYGGQSLRKPSHRGVPVITVNTAQTARFPVDGTGHDITIFVPQLALVPLAMMIMGAVAIARGWQTPGKRLAGLRVLGRGCAMCRELRRLGPFLLAGTLQMLADLVPDAAVWLMRTPAWTVSAVGLTVVVGVLLYYVWPLLVWRGAMPYDRATGFKVVRA